MRVIEVGKLEDIEGCLKGIDLAENETITLQSTVDVITLERRYSVIVR